MSRNYNANAAPLSSTSSSSPHKLRQLTGHTQGPIYTVHWSVDGRKLASGAKDEAIRIWNPERQDYAKASAELKGHASRVNQLRWDPTHPERLASAGDDGTLRFWDIRQGSKPTRTIENAPNKTSFLNLAWSPDAKVIAIGDSKDRLHFYDVATGKKVGEHREAFNGATANESSKDQINEVAFSHSGSHLFVPSGAGVVTAYNFSLVPSSSSSSDSASSSVSLVPFRTLDPHACVINCIGAAQPTNQPDVDPRGRFIAMGGSDSVVSLVSLRGFFCSAVLSPLENEVRSIGFSHDGELLAIAGKDPLIHISSVTTGTALTTVDSGARNGTNALAWHPSKWLLAYAGDDSIVRVTNLHAG